MTISSSGSLTIVAAPRIGQGSSPSRSRSSADAGAGSLRDSHRRESMPEDGEAIELSVTKRSVSSSTLVSQDSGLEAEPSSVHLWATRSAASRYVTPAGARVAAIARAERAIARLDAGSITDEAIKELDAAAKAFTDAGRSPAMEGGAAGPDISEQMKPQFERIQQRQAFAHQCARSSAFSPARMQQTKIAHYDAAAAAMKGLAASSGAAQLRSKAIDFSLKASEARATTPAERLVHDPVDRAGRTSNVTIAALRFLGFTDKATKAAAKLVLKELFAAAPKQIEADMLRTLRQARKENPRNAALRAMPLSTWDRLRGRDEVFVKAQLKAAMGEVLNTRERPATISTEVLLPLPTRQRDSAPRHTVVSCSQTEARALTVSLAESYEFDGIQRSNCHDIAQPVHARTLFHSRMKDADGNELLSLIRHGVLSASAFTSKGVKKVPAETLGAAVKKLKTDSLGIAFQGMSDRDAGRFLQRLARTGHGKQLLDGIRGMANEHAARETAAAAVSTLSPDELRRIHEAAKDGQTPSVRLTSVSALTPDGFRKGVNSNERRMWADQYAAWQAVRGEQLMQVPVLDDQGAVKRDELGRAITTELRVKLEVAAFNFAVNEFATKSVSELDVVSGCGVARPANDEAMEMLLGKDFRAKAGARDWTAEGWLGEALARDVDESGQPTVRAQRIVTVAKQVATMYHGDNYVGAGKDPYAMVKRLVVLGDYASAVLLNCKSGKDRTTEGEAQARELAVALRDGGTVPALHQTRSDPTAAARLWNLHQAGGGREVQDAATGYAGTKLKHPAVFEQYGFNAEGSDPLAKRMAYMGASSMVSS